MSVAASRPGARVPTSLLLANAVRHRGRLAIALVGVGFSIFLMVFQASLLVGFIQAAQRVILSVDGGVWIVPRGLPCFDFAARVPRRFADLAHQSSDIEAVVAVASGFTTLVRPDGARRAVLLIGAEPAAGSRFPFPIASDGIVPPDGVAVDVSHSELLGAHRLPESLEIGGRRAVVVRQVGGFGSFLGSPYVFANYRDAARMLHLTSEEASFLVVRTRAGVDPGVVASRLQRRLPEADVLTARDFAGRSASFWLTQTGAGGAILVAALLGFVVGLVITSQTMYASTMEQLDEFATLKAIGASNATVARLVVYQAALIGAVGSTIGVLATGPLVALARATLVAWIVTLWWLLAAGPLTGIAMCALGSLASVRQVLVVDPVVVLRR